MSETKTYKGKIKKVETALSLEEFFKQYFNDKGIDELNGYLSWVHYYNDYDYYDSKYFIYKNELYEFIEKEDITDNDISEFHRNEDGSFSFLFQFYSGATCLSELIDESLKNQTNYE